MRVREQLLRKTDPLRESGPCNTIINTGFGANGAERAVQRQKSGLSAAHFFQNAVSGGFVLETEDDNGEGRRSTALSRGSSGMKIS